MDFVFSVALLTVTTAVACALPGALLVVRRQSMLAEAMSHTVLPGIVVAMIAVGSINSPWLLIGAAAAGMLVVVGAEYLEGTGLLAGDSPQGVIYPALFSIGVILISTRFAGVQVSERTVLTGDVNLAAFLHLHVAGVDVGPVHLWVMIALIAVNALFLTLCWKELTLATFDPALAQAFGFRPRLLHYLLMLDVSVTVTAAFATAGSLLVVALMVVPPAVARLLSDRLPVMVALSVAVAVVGSLVGFWVAYRFDLATASGLATFYGLCFVVVWSVTCAMNRRRATRPRAVG
ncbi:manganese/zinc/iron transport system permease protein [Austwickia chelonae]|uniref:Putative ABC transporter permease protein n=1 Tax=Austwickia chelonae NBRC 105200 TaxID=1184607 RepID=K6UNH4_9MICO|nr:metal ABC transporter permease [Austwickia chelonae]GAB78981.1 putative ABC transporter permease protein [Austwickia chelonae NBRC 105200]SEV87757.1 manganese/zinc/iron transport system permease protein [Austwickia chelonae]